MTSPSAGPSTRVLEPYEFVVSPAMNAAYLEAEEGHHLRYVRGVHGQPAIVHPGLLLNHSNSTRSPTYRVGAEEADLHAKDETRFINPAFVGKRLRVTWSPGDAFEKRGRIHSVTETMMVDEDGREILRRRLISTKASRAQPIGEAPGQPVARPVAAPTPRSDLSSALELVLWGRPKAVTLERMRLFSGWPKKNIHTDEETARAAGCPAPIASATQNMGHLCELLLDNFGDRWFTSGTLNVTFVRPIYAGDTVISRALIAGSESEHGSDRYVLDLVTINQHGQVVTAGRGTALWSA
jgi:acyl dehydratase